MVYIQRTTADGRLLFFSFADYSAMAPLGDLYLQHRVAVGLVAGSSVKRALAQVWGLPRSSSSSSRTGEETSSQQSGSGSVLVEVDCLVSRDGLVAFRMCCFSTNALLYKSNIGFMVWVCLGLSFGVGRLFGTQERGGVASRG